MIKEFIYWEDQDEFFLKINLFSALEALNLYGNQALNIITFGATNYKRFGFATEKDIPVFGSLNEFKAFLSANNNIGLIELELSIEKDILTFSDYPSCIFTTQSKTRCFAIITQIVGKPIASQLIDKLISYPKTTLVLDTNSISFKKQPK